MFCLIFSRPKNTPNTPENLPPQLAILSRATNHCSVARLFCFTRATLSAESGDSFSPSQEPHFQCCKNRDKRPSHAHVFIEEESTFASLVKKILQARFFRKSPSKTSPSTGSRRPGTGSRKHPTSGIMPSVTRRTRLGPPMLKPPASCRCTHPQVAKAATIWLRKVKYPPPIFKIM